MKRRITELEQKLLDRRFVLSHKTYCGSLSKRTEFYVYVGNISDFKVMVYLDYKREKLDHYVIENSLPQYIDRTNLDTLERVYTEMFDLLYDNQEEIVEIVESINE